MSRLTGTRRVARSIWRTVSRPDATCSAQRRLVRSTPDSERSIAKSLPVVRREQISSAAAPGPHPISRTLSAGWTSMKSTAHRMRAGIVCAAMGSDCQTPHGAAHRSRYLGRIARPWHGGGAGCPGRVGSEICRAVEAADDTELVAQVDVGDDPDEVVRAGAEVVVDFTHPDVVMDHLELLVDHGIHAVVGTTGFDEDRLETLRGWLGDAPSTGILIAPNFSIGAILMMRFAAEAAPSTSPSRSSSSPPRQGRRALRHRAAYGAADRAARAGGRPRPLAGRHVDVARRRPRGRRRGRAGPRGCGSAACSPTRRSSSVDRGRP